VGFNLYCRLLTEAVEREKARKSGVIEKVITPVSLPPPTIDLPLAAYIPEGYVSDLNTRLSLYQRLANIKETEAVTDFSSEFGDRFGKPPLAVGNLLYVIKIKLLATKAGVESITSEHGQLVLRAFQGMHFDKEKLAPLARDGIKIGLNQIRISYRRLGKEWPKVLEEVLMAA
jgi:transcription-repair coupling factor (superfamily II helicase)